MATRESKRKLFTWRNVLIALLVLFILAYIGSRWAVHRWGPGLRQSAIEMLQDRFQSDVDLKDFDVSIWPSVSRPYA